MRRRILDAALEVLLAEGPPGLTSRAIARRLGIAHMTLFTYFANQGALLDALAAREVAPIRTEQERLEREAEHGDIVTVMRDALAIYAVFAAEHPELFHLAMVGPEIEGGSTARAQARAATNVAHLAGLVRIGIARGVFFNREPTLAAATALSIAVSPLLMFAIGRIPSSQLRDILVAETLEAALLYLTHPPATEWTERISRNLAEAPE